LAAKPNVYPDEIQDEADSKYYFTNITAFLFLFKLCKKFSILFKILDNFIEMVRRSNLEPTKKYKYPLTTSHEIGWITTPLVKIVKKT
jgi:hypothetical protein